MQVVSNIVNNFYKYIILYFNITSKHLKLYRFKSISIKFNETKQTFERITNFEFLTLLTINSLTRKQ